MMLSKPFFKAVCHKAKYVLDADIAKCFDRIGHQALLNKLATFPFMRRVIRAWLKAGVMEGNQLFPALFQDLLDRIVHLDMRKSLDQIFHKELNGISLRMLLIWRTTTHISQPELREIEEF